MIKKYLIIFILSLLLSPFAPAKADNLNSRVSGLVLLQAESRGQLWYVNPGNLERYFFNNSAGLLSVVRAVGLGISNKDFDKINKNTVKKFNGKFLIKVEDAGKAFYIKPGSDKPVYLGRPDEGFNVIKKLCLGISDKNLKLIKINKLFNEPEKIAVTPLPENITPAAPDGNKGSEAATTTVSQATSTPESQDNNDGQPENSATSTPLCNFYGEYFTNKSFIGDPATTTYDKEINFNWLAGGPGNITSFNKFSIRWTANCYFAAGRYKFTAVFDDALRAYIDGENFMQSWTDNGRTVTRYNERTITEGRHDLKIDYYENYGNANAKFYWEKID